jgi:2-polyprenyl-3-methyl-5-hydroxy-6-metoxy-1,4-benzoquinol methylase
VGGGRVKLGRKLRVLLERRLALLSPARRQRFELALATVERLRGDRDRLDVLDAGCEDGQLAEALARRRPSWRIVGADASPAALERARRRIAASDVANVELVEADLTEDTGDSRYDVVLAIECLVEIEDDRRALSNLAGALVPDGLLLLHVPERDWRPVLPGSAGAWRHEVRRGYSRPELVAMIEEAGLTVLEIRGSYRRLVQVAQEIRDRIKQAPIWVRALSFPVMVLAVRLEGAGLTWGREQALFALAARTQP